MNEEAKAFFAENPGVKMVLQLGADIFLPSSIGAATHHAKEFGLDVIEVLNERPIEDEQPEDEFEKQASTDGTEKAKNQKTKKA